MEERLPEVIAQHGNWLDVLCYTFRAVSDLIKALWIIIPCLTLVLCVYFITNLFRERRKKTPRYAASIKQTPGEDMKKLFHKQEAFLESHESKQKQDAEKRLRKDKGLGF